MKKCFFIPMMVFTGLRAFSQTLQVDSNYMTRVTSLTWMPDGKNILLSVVKYHKLTVKLLSSMWPKKNKKNMRLFTITLAFLLTGTFISGQSSDTAYKTKNVAILVYDEVELLDFAGPGEVFQHVEFGGKKAFNVYTVAVDKKEIISQQFLKVTAQYNIHDCPMPDILVLPGGNSSAQAGNEKLIAWINKVNQKAEYMLTVCNGVRLLAKTGALDGKMATSHYRAVDNLTKEFPKVKMVKGKRFVDNGRIITTEGVSAGIDGSLYLLGKIFNKEVPKEVATFMMYNWKPETLDVIIR